MSDVIDSFHHEGKDGITYRVDILPDHDTHPLEMDEAIQLTAMDWNPTDEDELEDYIERYDPSLEDLAELKLMRQIRLGGRRGDVQYFNTLKTVHYLVKECGCKLEDAQRQADRLYDWLDGYYHDQWFYVYIRVTPLDVDGNPEDDFVETLGGIEYDYTNRDITEYIEDAIIESNWNRRRSQNEGQLELDFN